LRQGRGRAVALILAVIVCCSAPRMPSLFETLPQLTVPGLQRFLKSFD
jgi:hypothetical protein